ncbi:ricin-type beta-trefoil lectin domain protein [Streptomyces sp. CB03911]|uniref:ricin-type beta-trefoil lectin domain protein n=1 Tax=Streptomyces sp. CB03911 TaxID=1804758 RepID=UPI00093CF5BC|nr:ricin-type beta-trefoil lectin domain protein [Streptomyces sp. CB03911]OKI30191.1 hypothetical protein A6A07_23170 [Streptomyces sp. CB03911]
MTAVLSLAAGLLSLAPVAAQAAGTTDFQAAVQASDAKHSGELLSPRPADLAVAEAKRTGKDVPIPSLTDEFSTSFATPTGKIRQEQHMDAQRTKRSDGTWTALDDSLVRQADGSLAPAAASERLVISGGGTGPLATMTTEDGKQLAVGSPFPGALPVPAVSGNTALFASVAPDTDLKVTATRFGGYTTVLVLHTPAAAANPAVRSLSFPATAVGLALSSAADGSLQATSGGDTVFTAPTPRMWSAAAPAAPAGAAAKPAGGATAQDAKAAPGAESGPTGANKQAPDTRSTSGGPGPRATTAEIPITASADAKGNGAIRLSPGPELLDGANTSYPIYVDPSWSNDARGRSHHAWVMSGRTDTGNFDRTGSADHDHPGVGYQGWEAPKGVERALYEFDISGYLPDTAVSYANLHVSQYVSSDWSCTTTYPVNVYRAEAFDSNVNWTNHAVREWVAGQNVPGNGTSSACYNDLGVDFNVTAPMRGALADTGKPLAFALVGKEGTGDRTAFKRFGWDAVLSTEYDHVPLTPGDPRAQPTPHRVTAASNDACWNAPLSSYGWITDTTVTLTSTVSSHNQPRLTEFVNLWDNSVAGSPGVAAGWSEFVPNGSRAAYAVPRGALKDGHHYGWQTQGDDGLLRGPGGAVCHFAVDTTPPAVAFGAFTDLNTQFPPSGSGQFTKLHLGDTGHFPFTASDPNPSGLLASGVSCVRWGYDPQLPEGVSDQVCGTPLSVTDITTKPVRWGTNTLYLRVYDEAGNMSRTESYSFYVPPALGTAAYGDITGDARPDIITADAAGNLVTYGPGTEPGTARTEPTSTAAVVGQAPEAPGDVPRSWANFRVTHRGSMDPGAKNDDLFVHRDGGDTLYYFMNSSWQQGHFDRGIATTLTRPNCVDLAACPGYAQDQNWQYTSQITPIGAAGPTRTPSRDALGATGFLAVEGADLWYFPPLAGTSLRSPLRVSAGAWDNVDLMIPGNTLAVGPAGSAAAPALWARARTSAGGRTAGDIYQYALTVETRADEWGAYTVVSGVTASPATSIGSGFTTTAYPVVGADGDQTDDADPVADLWGKDSSGSLHIFPGVVTDKQVSSIGADFYAGRTRTPDFRLKLKGDATAGPAGIGTTASGLSFTEDSVNGVATKVATFNGNNSVLATTSPVIDTRQSFTITTWARSTGVGSVLASQDTVHASSFILWSEGTGGAWRFGLATADDYNWPYQYTDITNSAALVQSGKWTRLTATYNATTGGMSLYVDGVLAGSSYHSAATSPAPSGNLVLGRYKYQGAPTVSFSGSLSDFAVYDTALPDAPSTTSVRHASSDRCLDVPGNDTAQGVRILACNNSPAQSFTLDPATGSITAGGKCLDITGGGTANGTGIGLGTCSPGAANQTWTPRADGSLHNPGSGRCLDLPNNDITQGSRLALFDCNGSPAQTWSILTAKTPVLPVNP